MFTVGQTITVTIKNLTTFGAFCNIKEDSTWKGLIHISEVSHDYVKNINDFLKANDEVEVKITKIDESKKQLSLSLKALKDPSERRGNRQETNSGFHSVKKHSKDEM